jgi:hypothetical protein
MKLQHRKLIQAVGLGIIVGPILRINGMSDDMSILFALVSVAISLAYAALEAAGDSSADGRSMRTTPPDPHAGA